MIPSGTSPRGAREQSSRWSSGAPGWDPARSPASTVPAPAGGKHLAVVSRIRGFPGRFAISTLLLPVVFAATGAPLFAQTTIVLQGDPAAGTDTFIAFASNVQNYGGAAQITTNSQSTGQTRGLLYFDLSGVPSGARIQSATLELYHFFSKNNSSEQLRVHRVLRSWTEFGATWRNYDGVNGWTTQGGDYDPAASASTTVNGTVDVWRQWNVTLLVQGWVGGSYPNHGLLLTSPPAGGNNERQFRSSEYAGNPAFRPRLTIVFEASDLSGSTKTVSNASPVPAEIVTYTIVVRNAGTLAAGDVVVRDAVDLTKLDSVTPGQGGVLSGGTITWNAATTPALASVAPTPAGDVTLSFTARVLPSLADGTVASNQAFLSSATQTAIPTDDPATAVLDDPTLLTVRVPVLALYKRILELNGAPIPDDPSNPPGVGGALAVTAAPGDRLTYGLFFVNGGSVGAVGFVARDGVPLYTDFLPDAYGAGRGIRLTYGATTDLTNALDGDGGIFDPASSANPDDPATPVNGLVTVVIGAVPAGSSGTIRFQVRVR